MPERPEKLSKRNSISRPGGRRLWGHTLVEVLVGMGIFTVFIMVLFGIYLMGIKSWKQAEVKTETVRNSIVALNEMAKEVRHTDEHSVQVLYYTSLHPTVEDIGTVPSASYCAICFLTPFDENDVLVRDSATGDIIYGAYLIYYVEPGDMTLRKRRIPVTDLGKTPSTIPEPVGTPLPDLLNGEGRIVSSHIKSLQLLDATGETTALVRKPSNPINVRMVVEKVSTSTEKPEYIQMRQLMKMFN